MAPDVKEGTTPAIMETQLSNSSRDDWESSYSEVEISIESNRAMTEDETSSSFSDSEESEPSYNPAETQYEELVEDYREESFTEITIPPSAQDLIAGNSNRQLEAPQGSASNRHLRSPSQSSPKKIESRDIAPTSVRRRKQSFGESKESSNHNNSNNNNNHNARRPSSQTTSHNDRDRVESISPAQSEYITSSASTKQTSSKVIQKQPISAGSNTSKPNVHSSHKSIKIPAIHNHKEEGDDDYVERKIRQEVNRRSRSLSRSENSGSAGHSKSRSGRNNNTTSRGKNRSRSNSNSKHGRPQQGNPKQKQFVGDNSQHANSSSSHSNHPERSIAVNPGPRRLASIHTSTPSQQSSAKSSTTKHSNYDGSKRVSWKSDPKESFSDWTLHVVYKDSNNKRRIDVYHVHRNVVGFGHRKSNFLLREIRRAELQEFVSFDSNNQTELELKELINAGGKKQKDKAIITRLKLPSESQARSVPMVLDFMYYTNETKQRMSADRSCNVFKVAEGLEVEALQKAIGEFYMKNLSLKNLGEFLTAATKVKADRLLTICKAKIGQMITVKAELSAMVPPKFMAEILSLSSRQLDEARRKEPKKYTGDVVVSQSRYWSKAACICASKNESIMTPKLFQKLTSEESLPYIDVSATPKLLAMESTFFETKTANNQLTSLQRRCVESIGDDFDAFQECFESHQEIAESLKHLPSNILSEILMKLMTRP